MNYLRKNILITFNFDNINQKEKFDWEIIINDINEVQLT